MNPLPASFVEPLPQLLMEVFGSNAASASYHILNHHDDYGVFSVHMEHPICEVIVKLAGHKSTMSAVFERTTLIHKLIRENTDVPVAGIVAVDTTYDHYPWRYMIQTRLQGVVWAEIAPQLASTQTRAAYRQIGYAVSQIHSIQFPGFGEIASGEVIESFSDALLRRAKQTIRSDQLLHRFIEVVEEKKALFESVRQAVLCHDDLHHYNVLFSNDGDTWALAGILDFDKAWAGHFETDLARLDFWDNMKGFREGYTTTPSFEISYAPRRPIYQLLWCLEYAEPNTRHGADLLRVCEELHIAPIVL